MQLVEPYVCTPEVILQCFSLAYARTTNGVSLRLLVPSSSCTVLLLWYCRLENFSVAFFHIRNVRVFNFRRMAKWRKKFNGENFLIYGTSCLTTCTTVWIGRHTFERKAPFGTTSFEKRRGGLIFKGGPIFERLWYWADTILTVGALIMRCSKNNYSVRCSARIEIQTAWTMMQH